MKKILKAFKTAFPYTIPVLVGYLFIGIAFGVMFEERGYNFLWAAFMSLTVFAGSGQYLAVNFFVPGYSLFQVAFLTLMVNIRHIFYGLSMLTKFSGKGLKKWYLVFGLTDETYSLLSMTKVPEGVDEGWFLVAVTMLDQSYWIIGSIIGSVAGTLIPFNSEGIEFAMTSLFVVLFIESWLSNKEHKPAIYGIAASILGIIVFGADKFVLPTMILVTVLLLSTRKYMKEEKTNAN